MTENLYDALEKALIALESDTEPEIVVSEYSENETELRSLVETAIIARAHVPGGEIKAASQRSRTLVLTRAAQLRQFSQSRPSIFNRYPRLAYFLVLAVVILMTFSGLTITSAQALPGDQLYPVKLVVEDIRLDLSMSVDDHRMLEGRYQERRIDEVNRLLALGRSEFVEFFGKVIKMEEDEWDVGGVSVHVNPQTILIGSILPGVNVEVEGSTQTGGFVLASEIHLQEFGFAGYVESMTPERWIIGGRIVRITAETQLNPKITVGDWVLVSVRADDLGNLDALVIDSASLPTLAPEPATEYQTEEDILDSNKESDDDDLDEDLEIEDDSGEQITEDNDVEHDDEDSDDSSDDHPKESGESDEDDTDKEGSDDEESDDGDEEQDEKDDD